MKTVTRIKIALESTDDKRLVIEDKIATLAHGHNHFLDMQH